MMARLGVDLYNAKGSRGHFTMRQQRTFELPEEVRSKLLAQGDAGARWLRDLPGLVHDLEHEWHVAAGDVLSGGSEALVLCARATDGSSAILKLGIPGATGFAQEVRTLLLANGRGYVRVFQHDSTRRAMLQEALGAPLAQLNLPVGEQIRVICATLQQAWITVPEDEPLQTGAEKARYLASFITTLWHQLGEPCSARAFEMALAFAEARAQAFDHASSVLVHGDAHSANTLQIIDAGVTDLHAFRFVDPDGMHAERACDLAVPMRDWSEELLAGDALALGRARCALISELTGVPFAPIWQWGFMERMSTGLYVLQLGWRDMGLAMLRVADIWASGSWRRSDKHR